jgi:crossover junction endodeoxyribonuclease RuvC
MSNVLGIDLSLTGTGLVRLDSDGTHKNARIETKSGEPIFERWTKILGAINEWSLGCEIVVIEGYSFGSVAGMRTCIELGGIVRFQLLRSRRRIVEVSPSTLKRFASQDGHAEKDKMILHVFRRWGVEFQSNDECDAYVLARIGQAIENGTDGLPQFQVEIIEQLKAGPKPKKTRKARPGGIG